MSSTTTNEWFCFTTYVSRSLARRSAATDTLIDDALAFVAALHRRFNATRLARVAERAERRAELARVPVGAPLDFPAETLAVREAVWQVAPAPPDLNDRRVEITGPVDRKMMINALNSGARVFMADLEDSCSPTWQNIVDGQRNLMEAVRGTLSLDVGDKAYRLNAERATLVVRPRGWHMEERHIEVDGAPASASLVDFGLYFFHNAARAAGARLRAVLLPAQDGEPPRGAALERRLRRRAGGARHSARHDPRHGA